jgi:hypothetical protein
LAVDIDAMRRELLKLLPDGDDVYDSVVRLLRSSAPPVWIDEFVGLATGIVYSASPATGTDHLLLAAALHLRGRRDTGGWTEGDPTSEDAEAATASVRTAADTMLAENPDGVPALLFLATLTADGTVAAIAERCTALSAVLRAIGADAVVFPEPVSALRWNAMTDRFEPADATETAGVVVVVGQDSPPSFADDLVVSHVSSLAQLVDLSRRTVRPITERAVFLANPRGDREWATVEAMLLRRTFYPRSRGFGRLIENADGPGTPEEILAAAEAASLLQIACGITTGGALELAREAELDFTGVAVSQGGLVVLPPGHLLPLADVLLAAGFSGVIGWRNPVSDVTAALATFMLHVELVDRGRTPAEAVREVRRWFRRPDTTMLPLLLVGQAAALDDVDGTEWMSLVYRGR